VMMNVAEVTAEDHFGESVILSASEKINGGDTSESSNNTFKQNHHYNTDITKAPYSLVADGKLSILVISRVDYVRYANMSTIQHVHHVCKERQVLWNVDGLQDLYIQRMNWEKHKQTQIMDVMERIAGEKKGL
jgi:hypothetical protein